MLPTNSNKQKKIINVSRGPSDSPTSDYFSTPSPKSTTNISPDQQSSELEYSNSESPPLAEFFSSERFYFLKDLYSDIEKICSFEKKIETRKNFLIDLVSKQLKTEDAKNAIKAFAILKSANILTYDNVSGIIETIIEKRMGKQAEMVAKSLKYLAESEKLDHENRRLIINNPAFAGEIAYNIVCEYPNHRQ